MTPKRKAQAEKILSAIEKGDVLTLRDNFNESMKERIVEIIRTDVRPEVLSRINESGDTKYLTDKDETVKIDVESLEKKILEVFEKVFTPFAKDVDSAGYGIEPTFKIPNVKTRDGFIAFVDGAVTAATYIPLETYENGAGGLSKKAQKAIEDQVEYSQEIGEDSAKEAGLEPGTDEYTEYARDHSYEDESVQFSLEAKLYGGNNTKKENKDGLPEVLLSAVINWESPYFRPSDKYEDYKEEAKSFKTEEEVLSWIEKTAPTLLSKIYSKNPK